MRQLVLTVAAVLAMTGTSFGLVALSYSVDPDPAAGLKSYTVHVSAPGEPINTLAKFTITGGVYQVWTAAGVQSEWLNNPDHTTPGDPKDSYVIFGEVRMPEVGGGPVHTKETITGGGLEGLGTLNNCVMPGEFCDTYLYMDAMTEEADLLHLVIPTGQSVKVELEVITPLDLDDDGLYETSVTHSFYDAKALSVPVPEPAAIVLVVLGIACLAVRRLR